MEKYNSCNGEWRLKRERLKVCRDKGQPYVMIEIHGDNSYFIEFNMISLPIKYDKMLKKFKKDITSEYSKLIKKSELINDYNKLGYGHVFNKKKLDSFTLDVKFPNTAVEIAEELFDFISNLMARYDEQCLSAN